MDDERTIGDSRCDPSGRVGTRALQYPVADRDDRARLVGKFKESHRPEHSALRVAPTQERFRTYGAAGLGRYDGLPHDEQVVERERALKLRGQLGALACLAAHVVAVELATSPAALLGAVHGRVSVAQQGERGLTWRLFFEQ